jgi:uncharacterized protein DUF6934
MNIERYDYSVNEMLLDYEFESDGPKGKIKKLVSYVPQNVDGVTYFNLGFGDLNSETGKINDLSVSDNKDTEKILATIAATVLEFTEHFPDIMVYAKGSTPARTRLYQIGIASNWNAIDPLLRVFGFINENWESFEKNVNYEAFLALRKKS